MSDHPDQSRKDIRKKEKKNPTLGTANASDFLPNNADYAQMSQLEHLNHSGMIISRILMEQPNKNSYESNKCSAM